MTAPHHDSYRRIATEEAFSVPEVYQATRDWAAAAAPGEPDQDFWSFVLTQDTPGLRRVRRQLLDLTGERLQIMDDNGVDVHLLSLTAPGVQVFDDARATALAALVNDRLAETIAQQLTEGAVQFMNDVPIPDEQKRKIFHQNAERVFRIPARDDTAGS